MGTPLLARLQSPARLLRRRPQDNSRTEPASVSAAAGESLSPYRRGALRRRSVAANRELDRAKSSRHGHPLALEPGNRHSGNFLDVDSLPAYRFSFSRGGAGSAYRGLSVRPTGTRLPPHFCVQQPQYAPYRRGRGAIHRGLGFPKLVQAGGILARSWRGVAGYGGGQAGSERRRLRRTVIVLP